VTDVHREAVSLAGSPIPGETGVRYRLGHAAQGLTISVAASDEVWVTHGCKRIRLTVAEARALSDDLLTAAEEAS
jgi:hypothetical protein